MVPVVPRRSGHHAENFFDSLHSDDILPQNVPDRFKVKIGNLVEEHLCRLTEEKCVAFQNTWIFRDLTVFVLCLVRWLCFSGTP